MPMKPVFLVAPVLIFALAWGIGRGVYLQQHQEVAAIQGQLEEQRRLQRLREQVAQSLRQVEGLCTHLAPSPDTEWLIRQVTTLAQKTGVEVSSIVPQAPNPIQDFTQLAVTLQLVTSYHELGKLLSEVESLPVLVRVEQLEVRSEQGSMAQVRLILGALYAPPLVPGVTPQPPRQGS